MYIVYYVGFSMDNKYFSIFHPSFNRRPDLMDQTLETHFNTLLANI